MSTNAAPEPKYDSFFDLITQRLYWFFIGPMLLILLLLGILNHEEGWLPMLNVLYLIGLVCLPISRWLEIRTGRGTTADGKPATMADLRSYTLQVVAVAVIALILANVWVHFAR